MEQRNRTDVSCGCKVGRAIESYDLTGANRWLVDAWTGDGGSLSLRDLAERFNEDLLRERMKQQDLSPLDGEAANTFRLLTDDDVSRGMRTQTRKRLERQGIDVEQLTDDFVSYQSIYRHLNECLDAQYTGDDLSDDARQERGEERIFGLKNRTETVTQDTLSRLVDTGVLALDEFDVLVNLSVICRECHTQYSVDEVMQDEGCDCCRT